MARVKINIPDKKPLFQTKIPLRVTDMNYGNHLGNDRILAIAQEARVQWLNSISYSELNIGDAGLIQGDAAIIYKNEGLYGDILNINLFSDDITQVAFDLLYQISTQRGGNEILIALVKTGMVAFSYEEKKVVPLPEHFKNQL